MAKTKLAERIGKEVFYLDGAMGTQLFARGVDTSKGGEYLNITNPEVIRDIHMAYLNAGSDGVITNSFGANAISLKRHGRDGQTEDINYNAAKNAREAVDKYCDENGGEKYVIGGFGPCGDFLEPLGMIKPTELLKAFEAQAEGLMRGGVDGFIVETMTAPDEAAIAVEAAKTVGGDLPVFSSFAFDPAGGQLRTMMGADAQQVVDKIVPLGVDAFGFNCGTLAMEEYVKLAEIFTELLKDKSVLLMAEPNAGKPELVEGEAKFNLTPADFAKEAQQIKSAGAMIIGGCCGTSPEHIAALTGK